MERLAPADLDFVSDGGRLFGTAGAGAPCPRPGPLNRVRARTRPSATSSMLSGHDVGASAARNRCRCRACAPSLLRARRPGVAVCGGYIPPRKAGTNATRRRAKSLLRHFSEQPRET
jgi:hypothetical protein